MPDHIKSLVVILVLAVAVFAYVSRHFTSNIAGEDFIRRRNLWFALTLAAFLTHNFWLYAFVAVVLLRYTHRREKNPPALFFFVLFALPMDAAQIPGLGVFNALFELSHVRILELLILLPAYLFLRRQNDTVPFGRTAFDKILFAYLLITPLLYLRDATVTDALRKTFYMFVDIFLPYVVFSRALRSMQVFRDALASYVIAIMVLALIAAAEFSKSWLLYQPLASAMQLGDGRTENFVRDGMLRVVASTGYPIVLGYLMVVGLGLYLFVQNSIGDKSMRRAGMMLLAVGLIAPLSRGPWIGVAVLLVVFIATGRYALRRLMGLALAAVLALSLATVLPGGEKIINLLPFIGSTEKENVDYRERLIANSVIVIQRNPWFGSVDFLKTPEMESMRQGQGIIDVVNSYLPIVLQTGITGLALFVSFFVFILFGIYRAMRSISDKSSEEYLLGRVLLAVLLAILVMIGTVSSISFIPIVYWSVAGMGVAYLQMVRRLNGIQGTT